MCGVPAVVRACCAGRGDRAAAFLLLAVRGLPPARADWGRAMAAELAGIGPARARWAFSLGCAWAAARMRARASIAAPGRGGIGVRALVLAGILAALALAVTGLLRYPHLRADGGFAAALAAFAALMLAYAWIALTLSRGGARAAVAARRNGLAGGVAVGVAWLLVLAPATFSKSLVFVPLAAALLVPAGVAVRTLRGGGDAGTARDSALWSGVIGALIAFIVWVAATYARDGRPYDAQLLRDFRASGSHDLAAYAVADNLGAALTLLVIVPLVALALGSLAGRVSPLRR